MDQQTLEDTINIVINLIRWFGALYLVLYGRRFFRKGTIVDGVSLIAIAAILLVVHVEIDLTGVMK